MQVQCYESMLGITHGIQIGDQQIRSHFLSFEKSFAKENTSFKSLTASHRPVAGVLLFGKRLRRSIPRTGLPDRSVSKSSEEAEDAMSYTNAEDGATVALRAGIQSLKGDV